MVSGHDPVESFFNSLRAVETGFRRAARDLESHWLLRQHSFGENPRFLCNPKVSVDNDGSVRKRKQLGGDGVVLWFPMKNFGGDDGDKRTTHPQEQGSCASCLPWSVLLNGFVQAMPIPFRSEKKGFQKQCVEQNVIFSPSDSKFSGKESNLRRNVKFQGDKADRSMDKKEKVLSLELFLCYAIDNLVQSLHIFDHDSRNGEEKNVSSPISEGSSTQFDHVEAIRCMIRGKKADVDCFLSNMGFARVGGAPTSLVDMASSVNDDVHAETNPDDNNNREESETNAAQKLASGLLNIPLSNVERLRSTLSTVSLTELIEYVPHLGRSSKEHPDKKKLFSVQDFFRYTEAEGKRFFEELDRDGDGQVTLEDLEVAMRKRKLPQKYARDFFRRTRSHLFSKSFGWKQFLSLIKQKDPTILRAYTTLCLSKSGTLQKNHILTSLTSAGLPANEDNAVAMLRCLAADTGGSISYGHFRNFMLLLPSDRLEEDPRGIWFEAATVVAVPPPVEIPASSVLKSALAGGLASALSTSLLYPVDTMKTRVQASTLSFPELIAKLPQIGSRGLYRGSIPAIIGQFSSHGLRTGIFEASKLLLINVAPTLPDIQIQSLASFCSTVLGTAVRIPCEVLKQRLQAGIFDNAGEAVVGTIRQDGLRGFFRGTGATLCREVPFYVAGMGLYAEAKKAAQSLLNRELEPWEIITVGALSGGLAAVVTTPFDVMKTRTMTAPQGRPVSMSMLALSILRHEGPLGLFKGAIPRFFWIAPLGAMNFAGYELAKKAMDKPESLSDDQLLAEKRI